jgi:hypothetical protein
MSKTFDNKIYLIGYLENGLFNLAVERAFLTYDKAVNYFEEKDLAGKGYIKEIKIKEVN